MSGVLRLGAAVAVAAAVAATGVAVRPSPHVAAPAASAEPVREATLGCPDVTGTPADPATLTVASAAGVLGPRSGHPAVRLGALAHAAAAAAPVTVRPVLTRGYRGGNGGAAVVATGPGAATVAASVSRLVTTSRGRGLLSLACRPPAPDAWVVGADGRVGYDDTLVLANPTAAPADVSVTVLSTTGTSAPPAVQAVPVPARDAVAVPVASFAPDAAVLALHVRAATGQVVAAVRDDRIAGTASGGADWISAGAPAARDLVVPGFAGGRGTRTLVLANPGHTDATVGIEVSTATRRFAPVGAASVVVPAGATRAVDLSVAFGVTPGAVVLHASAPVVASGRTVLAPSVRGGQPDLQWQPGAIAAAGPSVLAADAPPFGDVAGLFLTAPSAPATVRVTAATTGRSTVVQVPAGRTVRVAPLAALGAAGRGPLVLTTTAGAIAAARTLFAAGAHGPLVTSTEPVALPGPLRLPPVVPDLRAAVGR